MKVQYKVVRPFIDKHTRKRYKVGDIYECSLERFKSLFFKDNAYNEQYIVLDVLNNAKKAELLEVAKEHSIDVSEDNTKAEILKALEG
ncbi:hypothetical protein ISO99_06830 [Staphylococcus sp. 18_1_E_LY]|uniref:Uncharacterized protein n=1 Tax=Staphylococcus lloydii TaxID=2781774 RepID=A0A7T1F989_9STAP|nr:hypothetical protein [Staphylococcus lloydii]MBF7019625.1 hypothetical protein [Staphylococcus lloydii]MBF7027353.1 hypothetical protein [Staphylococcus lloydii]MDU9419013.1 hypothetical protein [Staphylococcus lloydii]QPM75017.1 hypothetical protein ISP08_11965 [Staphylococcus lloydii]